MAGADALYGEKHLEALRFWVTQGDDADGVHRLVIQQVRIGMLLHGFRQIPVLMALKQRRQVLRGNGRIILIKCAVRIGDMMYAVALALAVGLDEHVLNLPDARHGLVGLQHSAGKIGDHALAVDQEDLRHTHIAAQHLRGNDLVVEHIVKGLIDIAGAVPVKLREILLPLFHVQIVQHPLVAQIAAEDVGFQLGQQRHLEMVLCEYDTPGQRALPSCSSILPIQKNPFISSAYSL